jgi:uncharacterized membrane protein YeiB
MNQADVLSPRLGMTRFSSQTHRIAGYDLARAISLVGMIFVNIKYQMEAEEYGNPFQIWLSNLIDGRPAVTFVILAGVGLSLLCASPGRNNKTSPPSKAYSTILKRAAFLFLTGIAFSRVWYADILHFYGIYFAFAVFMVYASSRTLISLSIAAWIATLFFAYHFNFFVISTTDNVWAPEFWTRKGFLENLFFSGCYPVFPWIVYFFMGMWLGRQNISDCRLQKKFLLTAVLLIVSSQGCAWLVESIFITESTLDRFPLIFFLLGTDPFSSSVLAMLSASGSALLVIVLSVMVSQKVGTSKWIKPFLAMSQMSLTLYIAQIGICQLLLMLTGGADRENPLIYAWLWAAVFNVAAITFAYFWVNRFDRGPFEKLMRWISK